LKERINFLLVINSTV